MKVHYRGTLVNGTEFDSSYSRNQPAVFELSGVIPGWTEGLQLMQVGGKYRLWVPSKLAYGARGAGRVIGPNALLVFDIEPLEVVANNIGLSRYFFRSACPGETRARGRKKFHPAGTGPAASAAWRAIRSPATAS